MWGGERGNQTLMIVGEVLGRSPTGRSTAKGGGLSRWFLPIPNALHPRRLDGLATFDFNRKLAQALVQDNIQFVARRFALEI